MLEYNPLLMIVPSSMALSEFLCLRIEGQRFFAGKISPYGLMGEVGYDR